MSVGLKKHGAVLSGEYGGANGGPLASAGCQLRVLALGCGSDWLNIPIHPTSAASVPDADARRNAISHPQMKRRRVTPIRTDASIRKQPLCGIRALTLCRVSTQLKLVPN